MGTSPRRIERSHRNNKNTGSAGTSKTNNSGINTTTPYSTKLKPLINTINGNRYEIFFDVSDQVTGYRLI
jgi:hypothetical protein